VRLGAATTTDDAEGEVVAAVSAADVDPATVRAVLSEFVGDIEQVPTAVSAIKVAGKRAYQRVRDGELVELEARPVTVHELVVHDVAPGPADDGPPTLDVTLSVRCSSGTYIRAIARDLGAALGVGGHLVALRRTAVGPFDLSVARTLEDLADDPSVLPIADAARASFPAVDLGEEDAVHVRVGRPLGLALPGTGEHALFAPDGSFLALYEPSGAGARPVAVFVG
jgi:tRNA pseudouridine55 synthase